MIKSLLFFVLLAGSCLGSSFILNNATGSLVVFRVKFHPDGGSVRSPEEPLVAVNAGETVILPVPDISDGSWQTLCVVYSYPAYDALAGDTFTGFCDPSVGSLVTWTGGSIDHVPVTVAATGSDPLLGHVLAVSIVVLIVLCVLVAKLWSHE